MKVWVYVEGRSDVRALAALWGGWRQKLREKRRGIQLLQLDNKPKFLSKIGSRAMEKLVNDPYDLVVGLPDLYPNRGISDNYKHRNLKELQVVQYRLVRRELEKTGMSRSDVESHIARFHANAMKHDMEVLLLAATGQLQSRLKVSKSLAGWRRPPGGTESGQTAEENRRGTLPETSQAILSRKHR